MNNYIFLITHCLHDTRNLYLYIYSLSIIFSLHHRSTLCFLFGRPCVYLSTSSACDKLEPILNLYNIKLSTVSE